MKSALLLLIGTAGLLWSQEISHSTAPRLIHKVEPEYTPATLNARIEGDVVLSTTIGIDGIPGDIRVVRELGHGLDEKAVECVKQWRFEPASNHGEPVPSKATVEVNYRLPDKR